MLQKIKSFITSLFKEHPMPIWGLLMLVSLLLCLLITNHSLAILERNTSAVLPEEHVIHVHPEVENSLDYDPYSSLEAD